MLRQPTSQHIQAAVSLMLVTALVTTVHAASKERVLWSFNAANGAAPIAGLLLDKAGNLYGTTEMGGKHGLGAVFVLARSGNRWKETVLYSFAGGGDGSQPESGLVFDNVGNLYGTTTFGGASDAGTVFELSPANGHWKKTTLFSFGNGAGGGYPVTGNLLFDKKGNLYGTTQTGGSGGIGTIFELSPSSGKWKETVLYNFNGGNDGYYPGYGLVSDGSGNLYGTTGGGGSNYGIVYKLTRQAGGKWVYSVLYTFEGEEQGAYLEAGVIFDKKGNLYGEAESGNPSGNGVVFELTANQDGTWSETVLHAFDLGDGSSPVGGLVFDKQGNLYGTTQDGGAGGCVYPGCGVVFKLSSSNGGWTETTLHNFDGPPDGANPWAAVVLDGRGTVYGTTYAGGAYGVGSVFEVKP